ncbi:AraC family transcriptional regulator [Oceanimonas baumannii]|uniref:AraC family transcriptional regulator n=1 Tax=Oceanimonas baumannii TaxID=129578 RepID=UPI003A9542FD
MRVRDFSERTSGAALITCQWSHDAHEGDKAQKPYRWHHHLRGQLLCIQSGLAQIKTRAGTWILPPYRAGWIPPGALHSVLFCSTVSGYSVLLQPQLCEVLPDQPRVLGLNPLLEAMVSRSTAWSKEQLTPESQRIAAVMTDEIRSAVTEKLYLPMPTDPRLVRVAESVLSHPGSQNNIEQWAEVGALSARSLRRLMLAETGLSFAQWRKLAQLNHALALLAQGETVGNVAFALGYATPSNFIAMFKKTMGDSPARYFSCGKPVQNATRSLGGL